jgi:hypothetical protein
MTLTRRDHLMIAATAERCTALLDGGRNWAQGIYSLPGGPGRPVMYCLVGGVDHAADATYGDGTPDANRAITLTMAAVTAQLDLPGEGMSVETWNDTPGRIVDEVLTVLRTVAALARERAAASAVADRITRRLAADWETAQGAAPRPAALVPT